MSKYIVILEGYNEDSRTYTVTAVDEFDAMAAAEEAFPGWHAVDVKES